MDEKMSERKRVRDESSEADSPAAKRTREDILGLLDDSDSAPVGCDDSDIHDLYSVMSSFEQELSGGSPDPVGSVADLTSDSVEFLPDLGYLKAADGELGLPTGSGKEEENRATEFIRVPSESSRLGGFWPFDDEISGYDSFELGIGGRGGAISNEENDYVALDGIFDYSDVN